VMPMAVPPKQDGPFDPADPNLLFRPVPLKQALARNLHLCLIAEIAFDPYVIPLGKDPSNWDKLAQRNIAWSGVGSAQAVTTFDIRPTRAGLPKDQTPDELMIDWGNTPPGLAALIYVPSLNAGDILSLAHRMYASHRLTRVDDHTLRCETGGVSYVPIPPTGGVNCAGLLSVDMPTGLPRGRSYDVAVRQLTDAFAEAPPRIQSQLRERPALAAFPAVFSWRRVIGAFQLTIPVRSKPELLPQEERDLSVLRWIGAAIPPSSRWYLVFRRYLDQIAGRVSTFGGDPTQILPSPTGNGAPEAPCPAERDEERFARTGKIAGLIFDRFGDFEGFLLDAEDGEASFRSRERDMEALVERAWRERLRVTVWAERCEPRRPLSIVVREPPTQFRE